MLGFVGLLSSALASVVKVFVVMLLSFLQALKAPTEGEYKLATENGLVFPIESHIVTEEIFGIMMNTFNQIYGDVPAYVSTSCIIGSELDSASSKRYATYNYVFIEKMRNNNAFNYDIAQIDFLPVIERDSKLSSRCFVGIKTEKLHKQIEEANAQLSANGSINEAN
ncbi:hypothetical protein ACQKQC_06535 [Vibrio fortis]|uniref:hypothetical protein n=1 Tax=Vibrio fortis TaxID=212667 RepID=UPI004067B0CD